MKGLFDLQNTKEHPRLMAHRGFTPDAPENSLPSFVAAGRRGFWAIETDVRRTSDGVLVCCHNSSTKKMYNEDLVIEQTPFSELRKLRIAAGNNSDVLPDDGLRMPTFAEYTEICRKYGAVLFIETKGDVVGQTLAYVKQQGLIGMSVLSSVRFEHIEEARRISDEVFVHHIFSDAEHLGKLAGLGNAGLSYNITDLDSVPADLIARTHEVGVKMCLRAGDTVDRVLRMLGMGLDYIPTNCIDRLTAIPENPRLPT